MCLSLLGGKAIAAAPVTVAADQLAQDQVCPNEWEDLQPYARVITRRDDLLVRATPAGRVIGSIPKGWAVVVVDTDETGEWTQVTSHFGDVTSEDMGLFGSAPNFRSGWVATRYLEELGEFCNKPMAMMGVQILATADAQDYLVNEDWLQMADRLTQSTPQ
jgi:hypothetical protein